MIYAAPILATMMHRVKTKGMTTSAHAQLVCQAKTVRLNWTFALKELPVLMAAHVHRPLVANSVSVWMDLLVSGNQQMFLITFFTYHREIKALQSLTLLLYCTVLVHLLLF